MFASRKRRLRLPPNINFKLFNIMKRKLLFSTVMLVVAASAMAQNDITPSRYDFANQSEGQYVIDGCNNGDRKSVV